ncbi:GTP-binding YchF domain protein [Anaplasma phagocytophilum str. Annie]|nr:GTP-binding YchF domain protein [Anaplasma phagocytophilum str. Annie]
MEDTNAATGNALVEAVKEMAQRSGSHCCYLSAKLEQIYSASKMKR